MIYQWLFMIYLVAIYGHLTFAAKHVSFCRKKRFCTFWVLLWFWLMIYQVFVYDLPTPSVLQNGAFFSDFFKMIYLVAIYDLPCFLSFAFFVLFLYSESLSSFFPFFFSSSSSSSCSSILGLLLLSFLSFNPWLLSIFFFFFCLLLLLLLLLPRLGSTRKKEKDRKQK